MPELFLQDLLANDAEGGPSGMTLRHFPCMIGRHAQCDYRLNSPFISRRHCGLFEKDGRVWVEDLGSSNGTQVNGKPLTEAQPLVDGDVLDLAGLPFRVQLRPSIAASGSELRRVLVVDDDEVAAETLAVVLESWGHEVHVAHDGPAALQAAQAHPPDAVLLDIRLPGMDGYEVARQLRQHEGLDQTRLVGMTGHVEEEEQGRSEQAGFDQLLAKPVGSRALREALDVNGGPH
jgi:CheY-like chemotaxis protein